ncbi:MAG: hypothetical protein AB1791_22685, partial [Chloroflexota bacterium]
MPKGVIIRVVGLTLLILALRAGLVASGDGRPQQPNPLGSNQTVPSRTPTPAPVTPTATPPPPTNT